MFEKLKVINGMKFNGNVYGKKNQRYVFVNNKKVEISEEDYDNYIALNDKKYNDYIIDNFKNREVYYLKKNTSLNEGNVCHLMYENDIIFFVKEGNGNKCDFRTLSGINVENVRKDLQKFIDSLEVKVKNGELTKEIFVNGYNVTAQ